MNDDVAVEGVVGVFTPNPTVDDVMVSLLSYIPEEYHEHLDFLLRQLVDLCTDALPAPPLSESQALRVQALVDELGREAWNSPALGFFRCDAEELAVTGSPVLITTGGAATMTIEDRVRPAATFKPEVASLNMGSMNFGLYPMLERFQSFKHEWERGYLETSRERIFRNTFKDIEYILSTCYDNGTRFEFECYDIAHLYNLNHFLERGLVQPPLFVQSVFGILGGIGPHPEDVAHMKRTADRLFGNQYRWSVLGAGAILWIASRFLWSSDLHMVAVGVTILPVLAALFAAMALDAAVG